MFEPELHCAFYHELPFDEDKTRPGNLRFNQPTGRLSHAKGVNIHTDQIGQVKLMTTYGGRWSSDDLIPTEIFKYEFWDKSKPEEFLFGVSCEVDRYSIDREPWCARPGEMWVREFSEATGIPFDDSAIGPRPPVPKPQPVPTERPFLIRLLHTIIGVDID